MNLKSVCSLVSVVFLSTSAALAQATPDASSQAAPVVPIVSPSMLTFQPTNVGTISNGSQKVTLRNPATSTTNVTGYVFLGPDTSDFLILTSCVFPLLPGQTCDATVAFTPGTAQTNSARQLNIQLTTTGDPLSLTLSGTATTTGNVTPALQFSPASLTFPATPVGASAPSQVITITNPANRPAQLIGSGIAGLNSTDYYLVANGCGTKLAAFSSCTLTVGFSPSVVGADVAELDIYTTNTPQKQTVAFNGTGQ